MTLTGFSILIIDDDEAVCEVIAMQLQQFGANTWVSLNLADATRLIGNENFDAVITDFRIPPHSAIDILKIDKLRAGSIPVIILTGMPDFDESAIIKLGAACVLDKPVSARLLCEKLLQMIDQS